VTCQACPAMAARHTPHSNAMARSVLDDLGEEVTGIVAPVSICMALTVLLVRVLNPSGATDPQAVVIASIVYEEQVRLMSTFCKGDGSNCCHPTSYRYGNTPESVYVYNAYDSVQMLHLPI